MLELPSFELGQKVILHYQPIESTCKQCEHVAGTSHPPARYAATVIPKNPYHVCPKCGCHNYSTEGWVALRILEGKYAGAACQAPWNLLEIIEDVDLVLPTPTP